MLYPSSIIDNVRICFFWWILLNTYTCSSTNNTVVKMQKLRIMIFLSLTLQLFYSWQSFVRTDSFIYIITYSIKQNLNISLHYYQVM